MLRKQKRKKERKRICQKTFINIEDKIRGLYSCSLIPFKLCGDLNFSHLISLSNSNWKTVKHHPSDSTPLISHSYSLPRFLFFIYPSRATFCIKIFLEYHLFHSTVEQSLLVYFLGFVSRIKASIFWNYKIISHSFLWSF